MMLILKRLHIVQAFYIFEEEFLTKSYGRGNRRRRTSSLADFQKVLGDTYDPLLLTQQRMLEWLL